MEIEVVEISTDSFNRLCRTCLEPADINLFQTEFEDIKLVEMFEKFTIKMNEKDNLPHNICKSCIDEILRFYQFRKKCLDIQAVLTKVMTVEEDRKLNTDVEIKHEEIEICDVDDSDKDNSMKSEIEQSSGVEVVKPSTSAKKVAAKSKKSSTRANPSTTVGTMCYVCNIRFESRKALALHREEPGHPKGAKTIVPCPICAQPTQFKRMKLHLIKHSSERACVCNVCGKAFKHPRNLSRHASIHTTDGEKPFKCDVCGKGFTQAQTRKAHMRIHAEADQDQPKSDEPARASRCKECGKLFRSARYYAEHVSRTCTSEKKLPADKPKRRYGLLAEHEKQFLCQYCGKRLSNKVSYELHVRSHEGIKPYLCKVCGKRFTQVSVLDMHKLTHTGEKPHACKICNKAFSQRSHVSYHMKLLHSTERPFVCVHCGKAFALKGILTEHLRTHTGETPYICNYCGKGFRNSNNMNKHRKSQHGHVKSAEESVVKASSMKVIQEVEMVNLPIKIEGTCS